MGKRRIRKIGDGLGEILDGDVLRVGMADSKNPVHKVMRDYTRETMRDQTMRVTDGGSTGDPLWAHKPGWRTYHDAGMRQHVAEDRALDRADYLTDKDTDFANTSPAWGSTPPTGFGSRDVPGIEDIPEGTSCTINGWPGKWKRVNGTMVCVPNNRKADSLSCYDLYDLQISDQWRSPATVAPTVANDAGAWSSGSGSWIGPNLRKELGEDPDDKDEDDEDEDEQDPFMEGALEEARNQVSTHHESSLRRDVPDAQDRLQREHQQRLQDLKPQFKQWAADRRQLDSLYQDREQAVGAEIARYEESLRNAYKEGK